MTMDGGPITVCDGVNLGTRVTMVFDSKSETVVEIHVNRGILSAKMSRVETTTYNARNVDVQLSDLEGRITTLRDRQAELEKHKTALQAQINASIEKMSF